MVLATQVYMMRTPTVTCSVKCATNVDLLFRSRTVGGEVRWPQGPIVLYIPDSERSTLAMGGRARGSRATHLNADASMAAATIFRATTATPA